ncbi:adenylate/guanylate cyclase domain-containing protein [Gordonia sp. (in: high G+C Gram-positive bacteria)]|uniref:adenylate/guanylate cyclase domain-containing protein n=1 Tax=Gordonia sp. (in: high G+C Gram-positive bacteria) TaxID=84139 RepID=UPI003F9B6BD8
MLLGSADQSARSARLRVQTLLTFAVVLANVIGIVIALGLGAVGIPEPSLLRRDLIYVNFIGVPVYIVVALVVGVWVGTASTVKAVRWAISDETPTSDDAHRASRAQRRLVWLQGLLWVGGAGVLALLYGLVDPSLIPKVVLIVLMCATVVVAIASIYTEILLRPVWAKIMEAGLGLKGSSVRSRAINSWVVGTGIPLTGITLVVLFSVLRPDTSTANVLIAVTVLAVVAGCVGLGSTMLFVWSITGPLRSVRSAMSAVRHGDVGQDVDLLVYDGSELGELQYGFNTMVGGLREQERLRDLFGRHVGRDVAAAALRSDPELGGSERTVAVVFVDVIGSTTIAEKRSPTEVVALLNRFFAVIVEVTERNGGLVNKFEGDAVLAIFGAPVGIDDPASSALAASREIADGLAADVPELSAGIGVSYGTVVAGNVGAVQRFEYTVIGDPVNESARLSEVAKHDSRHPVASKRVIDAASDDEAARWTLWREETLRGRTEPTPVYTASSLPPVEPYISPVEPPRSPGEGIGETVHLVRGGDRAGPGGWL